jgi:hypothetical protein
MEFIPPDTVLCGTMFGLIQSCIFMTHLSQSFSY